MRIHAERDVEPLITFDWTRFDSVSDAVVTVVATVADDDPSTIERLYEAIDPDSLDHLFATANCSRDRTSGSIEFVYHGFLVVVDADGEGRVYERDERQLTGQSAR